MRPGGLEILGRFAALFDHLDQQAGDLGIVDAFQPAIAGRLVAVLDCGVDKTKRARAALVAIGDSGLQSSVDVVPHDRSRRRE